jgi:hypothetical protein
LSGYVNWQSLLTKSELGIPYRQLLLLHCKNNRKQHCVHNVKIQVFVKERDSLKALLVWAEHSNAGKDSHGQANGTAMESDISKELAEIQQQFDTYQTETDVESICLHEDAVAAQHKVAQLTTQITKANAKIEIAGGLSCLAQFPSGNVLTDKRCRLLQDVTGVTSSASTYPAGRMA